MLQSKFVERRTRPSQAGSTLVQSRTPSYGAMTAASGRSGQADDGTLWFRFARSKFSDAHKLGPDPLRLPEN